ncbi:MAG: hypothetical protein GOV00_00950 [Candidatus Altiarchaeota archaeon]|nr:hypothetical protein [Candidatus Altiarchaeota archaeon]
MSEEKLSRKLTKLALKHFGKLAEDLGISEQMTVTMKQANLPHTGEEFSSLLIMTAIILPLFITFPIGLLVLLLGASPILSLMILIFGTLALALLIFIVGYIYPGARVSDIKKNITNNLPFATIYMATLANSGMTPAQMFEVLGRFEEFGYVAKEASRITRDVKLMGVDIATAIERAAERTPSTALRELLWGIKSTITTGGDIKKFLVIKSNSSMADYRRFLDKFVDQLSILIEIYITAVIVGSIFFIIMGIILGMMGGGESLALVRMVIYFGIPMISIMFMILISGLSPE